MVNKTPTTVLPLILAAIQAFGLKTAAADVTNTLLLKGVEAGLETVPPPPAAQFWAYCSVKPGLCVVVGNGVIAPGTKCYCGDYEGETWSQ